MGSDSARRLLAVGALAGVWGSTWLGIKIGLAHAPPLGSLALRFVVAAVSLNLWLRRDRQLPRRGLPRLRSLGLALLTFILPYWLVYWGELYVSSGLGSVLFSTQSLFVAAFSRFCLPEERTTPRKWVGIGLGLLGLAVVFRSRMGFTGVHGVAGASAILAAAASAAAGLVALRRCGEQIDPMREANAQIRISAVFFVAGGFVEHWFNGPARIAWASPALWLSVVYLGLVGTALAFVIYFWLARNAPALVASLAVFASPLVAVLLGWLVGREQLDALGIAGGSFVLYSIVLTQG